MIRTVWRAVREAVRRYFIAGLLAFAPIAITIWAISWIVTRLDNLLLPRVLQWVVPGVERAPDLPPLVGALFTFVVILASGVIALFAAGLLTRDGVFVLVSLALLLAVPVAVWHFGFGG